MKQRPAVYLGLYCPKCGERIDNGYIAMTYGTAGGVERVRYCSCGAKVTSLERLIGADQDGLLITGLLGQNYGGPGGKSGQGNPKSLIRQLARALGGTVTNL